MRHVGEEIDLTWHGTLDARPDGSVALGFVGRAARAFRYNRIGFCVLHPIDGFAGQRYRGESPRGPVTGVLPERIAVQPFVDGVYVPWECADFCVSHDSSGLSAGQAGRERRPSWSCVRSLTS